MNGRDDDFNVRLGRIRDRGGGQIVDQMPRAGRKPGIVMFQSAALKVHRFGRS